MYFYRFTEFTLFFMCICLFAITPFHSHAPPVTVFNGLNFSECNEQVKFHLSVMNL